MPQFVNKCVRPIKRLALWHVDGAMRYDPAVRLIRRHGRPDDRILEAGSGALGLTLFLPRPITGYDVGFDGPTLGLVDCIHTKPKTTRMPFDDNAFDFVLSMDTLEHVPLVEREPFVRELVRISKRWIILAFPSGQKAAEYDLKLFHHFQQRHGINYRWTQEHLDLGLPDADAVAAIMRAALDDHGGGELSTEGNFNVDAWLRVWKFQMSVFKPWRSVLNKLLWPAMPYLRRRHHSPTYRTVLIAEKSDSPTSR